ncbi:MAG: Hint domain-containing protein [Pseudomonadota bacterium]
MPVFYGYQNAIFGTQSTVNGSPVDYNFAPPLGGDWSWTGSTTNFHVRENDGATLYNGDNTNEQVGTNEQLGGVWEQVTEINGTYFQTIWDYTFEITDGTNTFRVAVIDVDLNNDNDLSDVVGGDSEDGYYLVFPDGVPTPGVDYTVGNIVENDGFTPHLGLGAEVVCYASGTLIDTALGPRPIEALEPGDMIRTKGNGLQPVVWHGVSRANAYGKTAPVVIRKGALGNTRDLVVSQQHRMLVESFRAELLFGESSVLVKAKDLVDDRAIYIREGGLADYHHLLLPNHEIIFAEGIPSESFQPGAQGISTLSPENRLRLLAAVPDLEQGAQGYTAAHPSLKRHETLCLMAA